MRRIVYLFILFLSTSVFAINVDKKEILSPKKFYTVGDIVKYHVAISDIKNIEKIDDKSVENIEILSKKNNKEGNRLEIYRTYQLFSPDLKKLPDIVIKIDEKTTLAIKGLPLNIKTVITDKDKKIEDILPPIEKIKTNYSVWPLILLLIVVILFALSVYYFIKKMGKKKDDKVFFEEKTIEPLEFLKKRWGLLKKEDFKEKRFYYEITDLLKSFLSRYYGKNYAEMTTSEFEKNFFEDMPVELKNKLVSFLLFADKVKFSKYVPTYEDIADVSLFMSGFISYYEDLKRIKDEMENEKEKVK